MTNQEMMKATTQTLKSNKKIGTTLQLKSERKKTSLAENIQTKRTKCKHTEINEHRQKEKRNLQ